MIDIVTWSGEFFYPQYKEVQSISSILNSLRKGQNLLKEVKKEEILDLFEAYSRKLINSSQVNQIEGVPFLTNWLRKGNFSRIVKKNLKSVDYLENFVGERKRIKAQPRGIVCHWIAGNVPTLGIFSLFQSILVGNANIMRIPPESHQVLVALLQVFSGVSLETGLSGQDILKSVGLLYFPRTNNKANHELSQIADSRIVWGGEDSVKSIIKVPKRSHCEDIIFGPKYSLAIFDSKAVESEQFSKYARSLVGDVCLFDQSACTSPHVIFFEKSSKSLSELAQLIATEFTRFTKRYQKTSIDQFIATKIINKRAEYALESSKSVLCPKANDWTILIDDNIQLEEPIESRTIFLKEIESVMDVVPLITRKIQTIGCAIEDKKKLIDFADQVTYQGVSRCVSLGQMNYYDSPWDGILLLSRLVNWVTLYYGS